jgi:tRNA G10  N-methylase Trm11
MPTFFFHFSESFLPFRLPELDSLLLLAGIAPQDAYDAAADPPDLTRPYMLLQLPSAEAAVRVARRGILVTAAYEVWGDGRSYRSCIARVRRSLGRAGVAFDRAAGAESPGAAGAAAAGGEEDEGETEGAGDNEEEEEAAAAEEEEEWGGGRAALAAHFSGSGTWSLGVASLAGRRRRCDPARQAALRRRFSFLPFRGAVSLRCPELSMWVMEDYLTDDGDGGGGGGGGGAAVAAAAAGSGVVRRVFLLRRLAVSARALVGAQSLKRRRYLGPTSMENEMSLLMANQGLARRGSRVLDPFVGTGSLLLSASNFGAQCTGWDIDTRVLRGVVRGRRGANNVWSNFDQYGLPRPEIVRCDLSTHEHAFRWPAPPAAAAAAAQAAQAGLFDAIICDPPYGIRAGARRGAAEGGAAEGGAGEGGAAQGGAAEMTVATAAGAGATPLPAPKEAFREAYAQGDVMADLLALAARALTLGGRLVYLLPSLHGDGKEGGAGGGGGGRQLPEHPCLRLVACSEQPLTASYVRLLVTMEKVRQFEEEGGAGAGGGEGGGADISEYAAAAAATRQLAQATHTRVTCARRVAEAPRPPDTANE